ncbi:MAG TPA: PadR family transcriptional regulator [Bacillota bacterium]|nr:PadR family transcriptional regulator [Bacillota bacterium]
MAKENKTKYAILGVLNLKPSSGYDIKKFCDQSIAHFWNENYGHIYPVLKTLEADGWVTKTIESNEGKPDRHVYCITDKGRDALIQWLMQPAEIPQMRYEFLLKMFFSKDIPIEIVIKRLRESEAFCRKLKELYLSVEESLKQQESECPAKLGLPFWRSTLRYGMIYMEGNIRWCEEMIEYFQSLDKKEGMY